MRWTFGGHSVDIRWTFGGYWVVGGRSITGGAFNVSEAGKGGQTWGFHGGLQGRRRGHCGAAGMCGHKRTRPSSGFAGTWVKAIHNVKER